MSRTLGPATTQEGQIYENFERGSISSSRWTTHLGNVTIVGNASFGASAESGIHIASWIASTVGINQMIAARYAADKSAQMESQVFGRRRTSDVARYAFHYHVEEARWEFKYDGVPTESTRLLATDAVASAPSNGDLIHMEIRGTDPVLFKGYRNGVLILEASDSHADRIVIAGTTGLTCRARIGQTLSYPSPVFSDFWTATLL